MIASATTAFWEDTIGLRERLMEAMGTLGLHGMKACYDEIMAAGIKTRSTPEKILCELLETELAERKARSIRYRMGLAKFPVDKDLDQFNFTESPVNETQVSTATVIIHPRRQRYYPV